MDLTQFFGPLPAHPMAKPEPSSLGRLRAELKETRRRLGCYTALQSSNEPWILNEAEISRRLAEVITVLDAVLVELERR